MVAHRDNYSLPQSVKAAFTGNALNKCLHLSLAATSK